MTSIKIVNKNPDYLPKYQTDGSAGMDLHADITLPLLLKPMQRDLVPTGVFVQLPEGIEAQIRPRSGLAFKHGITVLNAPATIDSDYRGEYLVMLINLGSKEYTIEPGDRIGQLVLHSYERIEWEMVDSLDDTERGQDKLGSTGR